MTPNQFNFFTFPVVANNRKGKRLHGGRRTFLCDMCGYACTSRQTLNTHYAYKHGNLISKAANASFTCCLSTCGSLNFDPFEPMPLLPRFKRNWLRFSPILGYPAKSEPHKPRAWAAAENKQNIFASILELSSCSPS